MTMQTACRNFATIIALHSPGEIKIDRPGARFIAPLQCFYFRPFNACASASAIKPLPNPVCGSGGLYCDCLCCAG